jgi:hypothetical protein
MQQQRSSKNSMKLLFFLTLACADAFLAPHVLQRPTALLSKSATKVSAVGAKEKEFVIPLADIRLDDIPKVGGKTASLGEMIRELAHLGVDVPGGFGVSSTAYDAVFDQHRLRERLTLLLEDLDGT